MKRSDIEKQLKNDLSAAAPSDFDGVWNKCTTPAEEAKQPAAELVPVTAGAERTFTPIKKAILFSSIVLVCCFVMLILCLTLFGKSSGGLVLPSHSGYFTIDINPSVQINYNENGIVTSSQGLNADGEELLRSLDLNGKTYDIAANEFFDECVSRGYFSATREDNVILMTASKSDGEKDDIMTAEMNKRLTQAFDGKKITGVVISDTDNSKWQKEADKYGINGQKYELILRYLDMGGELDESEYGTISIRELYSHIAELNKTSKDDKEK